jgi:hypothetical protein
VLEVIRATPRHLFVDEALASRAYEDTALPIGYNQTISQPYVVAAMTDLVIRNQPQKVLEIGTGSGYQAAVLAALVPKVYTVERISRSPSRHASAFANSACAMYAQVIPTVPKDCRSSHRVRSLPQRDRDHPRHCWSVVTGRWSAGDPLGSRTHQLLTLVTRQNDT